MAKRRSAAAGRPDRPAESTPVWDWRSAALVGAALLTPLAAFGATVQNQAVDATVVVFALAAVLGCYLLAEGRASLQPTRLTVAWSVFLGWACVSALASGRVWSAFMGEASALAGLASLIAFTAISWSAGMRSRGVESALIAAAPWFVALQSVWALVQISRGGPGVGSLPNSTYLGEFVVLLLPWVIVRGREYPRLRLIARIVLVLVAVTALGASGSRVAAVLALVWTVWTFSQLTHLPVSLRRWAGPGAVALVLLAGLVFARAEILGSVGVGTLGARPQMWRLAARAVALRPLLGWGPDGFLAGGARAMTPQVAERGLKLVFGYGNTDPHNLVVFIVVSTGIVGMLAFFWAVAELLLRWRRLRLEGKGSGSARWALALCAGVLLTAPATPHILPLLAIATGLSVAPLARRASEERWQRPLAVSVVAVFLITSLTYGANALARMPYEDFGPEVSVAKAASVEKAAARWRFDPYLAYLSSLHLGYAVQADNALASQRPDLRAIERAASLDTHNPFYALELARTLDFYSAPQDRVEEAFEETLARYPGSPLARAEFALFLARRGRTEAAIEHLRLARLLDDGTVEGVGAAIEAAEKELAREP